MADNILGRNKVFPIYNEDGTTFNNLVLRKSTVDSVVMSLGDKITGDVYYKDTTLAVTMGEYIVYNDVKYTLVNQPTVVKEGMVSDNGDLNGMTKYSFVFYHPMYHLLNFPFTDVAVQTGQEKYLSQNKSFSWIGTLVDYVAKINKNLQGTQWVCAISNNVPQEERTALSEVLAFDNATIADALKRGYETWEVPYIIDQIKEGETYYSQGKRFLIQFGLPSQEIIGSNNQPFVFKYGQGVGLKNHSRNPRNNKIITRIAGYGSEDNIPWGYPQIVWTGNQEWKYTINNSPTALNSYPIYEGIVGGEKVKLIKHPFTRTHLMPSIYRDTVNKKVNPNASGYNPSIEIKDYYDADSTYVNPIVQDSPSYEIHEFEKIKPELGVSQIEGAVPYNGTIASDGEILLSDFKLKVMERASSTSIDMERTALLGLYDNITLPSSYVDSGSQEAYSYQSSIGAPTDDKRKVEFKSSNVNFSEVVVVPNETPSSSTEWIDDIDENGNYIQGYFEITLPVLSFDLYASAALTQEMQINMRSGACIGCTFPVQVDWEDYRKNFYDAEGNFAPNGAQRNLTKYPKSDEQQITVIVQKDTNTFGTLMPNIYQQPAAGDEYVILGISLPLSYISDAEERLDADMKQYMRDNNVYYFDYPLKFDEYFLAKNINILSQLRTNTIVRFQYNNEQLALYVKQLTIKYDNTPLPQYDITLTDDVEIVLNPVGQVSDDVSKLRVLIGQGGVGGSGSYAYDANAPYVRKDIDDTTNNIIRILKGLQLGENFSTGLLGEGGIIRVDADGKTYIEADKLYVRMKFYADTVEVRRFLHTGGNSIKSPAGINCTRVEYIDSNGNVTSDTEEAARYRCYFKATDNDRKITNDFVVGDLAFCGETNVDNGSLSQHRYWRAVVGRNAEGVTNENNEMWIDLSATDCEAGSDIPIAQDDIIQLGNKTDTTRQGAIIEYVSGEDAPSYMIYQGINSYSLNGRNKLALGYNSSTGRAYLNVYGDFFFGDPTKDEHNQYTGSYIKYDAGNQSLEIKGTISAKSPIAGTNTNLEQYIRDMASQGGWTQEQIEALIVDETSQQFSDIDTAIQTLQNQADGAIETWFYNGAPTLSNLPASNWNTDALKEKHLGDLYYDNESGYAYRFIKTGNTYSWNQLSDSAVIKALANAAKAQDTADSKRKVFVRQPQNSDEYDEGDFWVNATYPATGTKTYENDILRAVTPKSAGVAFDINHWTKASKYTDDSALEAFLGEGGAFETYKAQVKTQLDGKAETWYQSTNPASNWTDTETKNQHIGDIWHNTSNSTVGGVESGRDAIWNGTAWVESDVPASVYDKIDGKADIFVSKPTTYNVNDMWIIEEGLAAADMPTGCKHKDIVISSAKRTNSYHAADWSKKDRYTDDTALTTFINGAYEQFKQNIQAQVDGKAETWYQATDPSTEWDDASEHVGDIWHNSSSSTINGVEAGQDAIWNGTSWEVSAVPAAVFNKIDGKASIFINTVANPPSNYRKNDLWILPAAATINGISYIKGELLTATTTSATYNAAHWTKKVGYTNDAKFDSYINQILNGTGATGDSATVANAIRTIRGALNNTTTIDGGLVLTSMIGMKDSSNDIWAGISGQYQANETGDGYKGHGIAAWYGGGMVDKEVSTSATNAAKSLFRFDGSGYLAGGNITWDKNGIVTIANVYSNVDGTQVAWSGQSLQYITNLATLLPTKLQSGVTYLDPKVSFWSLSIQGKAVATQEYVSQNYLSIAFFKRLFQAYNGTTAVNPNNTTATIDNIKAMFGFWTDQYLSALGKNASGGSSGGSTTLAGLTDTSISNLTSGQVLSWNGSKWVNTTVSGGGADISDITAALSNYLPLSGGTMTGVLTMKGGLYEDARNGALNMNNSDIYGANSIYFADLSDTYAEGLQWYRTADNVDSLWVKNGVIYFTPNRPLGGTSTHYTVLHSGNYINYIDSFAIKGWNVIDSTENDTVAKWGALKNIVSAYNATGKLLGQPQQYGLVLSLTTGGTEVHQMWFNQPAGTVYHRGGNASGWDASSTSTNAWRAFVDSSNLGQYLVGACGNGTSNLTDDTEIITSYAAAGGFDAEGHVNKLYRRTGAKVWGYIKSKIAADTTLNVASATKLQTARTLWGQSFDGTANVSGNMSSVGNISMTGYITSTSNPIGTFIGGVTTAVINCNGSGGYMPILNAPTKNGRISLSTYPKGGDVVYLGYASSERIQAGTNSFNSELRWSPNDYLGFYSRGTTDDDVSCGVYLNNLDSTTNQISEASILLFNSHQNNNGGILLLQGTGNLVIGGGEGVRSLANLLKTNSDEATYIAADTAIYLYANCGANDNKATARKGFQIDTSANIYPIVAGTHTNNVGYLGNASYRFAGLYSELVNTNSLTIGSCVITWDSTAGMLKFSKGIYSQESVSALGANNSSATAATTLAQLTDTTISNPSNGQVLTYSGGKWVNSNVSSSIDQSTLNAALSNYVTTTKLNSGAYMMGLDILSAALDDTTGQAVIGFNTSGNPIDSTGRYGAVLQWASTNSIAPSVTNKTRNWYFQLIGTTSTGLYWRRQQNGLGWTKAKLLLDSSNITDYAVTIDTDQTITGIKTFNKVIKLNGYGIEDVGGSGLLVYHPVGSWGGISDTQWGVGATNSQGVIRSNNNPLVHYRGGVNYDIIDALGGTLIGNLDRSGDGGAFRLVGSTYTIGLHLGSGGINRGIYEWSPSNAWLLYFTANNTILNHGNLNLTSGSIITTHGSSNHVNGATNAVINCNYTSYGAIFNAPVKSGRVSLSTYPSTDDVVYLNYFTTANVTNNTNTISHSIRWSASTGNLGIDVVPSTKLDVDGAVRGTNMVSTTTDGTAPFYASATTLCTNVNADLLDGWHRSDLLGYGYVMTNSSLSSYWCKAWDATVTNIGAGTERHMQFLVTDEYSGYRGIISVKIRQNGANDSGAYNFGVNLVELTGNLVLDRFRLYYNNSTGYVALYANVGAQWGSLNFTRLKMTGRYGELKSFGTLYSTTFSSAQTLPSSSYKVMVGSTQNTGDIRNTGRYLSYNDCSSSSWVSDSGSLLLMSASDNSYRLGMGVDSACAVIQGGHSGVGALPVAINPKGGNVGIGTTTPTSKLHVVGTISATSTVGEVLKLTTTSGTYSCVQYVPNGGATWSVGANANSFYFWNATANAIVVSISKSGSIVANGDVTALSDMRYKSLISKVNTSIDDVSNLPIFYFKWKAGNDDNIHIGTSAQAVQKLFPELVLGSDELSVNYAVLGTALGILSARKLMNHEERIKILEEENERLRTEINELKGVA